MFFFLTMFCKFGVYFLLLNSGMNERSRTNSVLEKGYWSAYVLFKWGLLLEQLKMSETLCP